jgi:hypothetical protein
VAAANGEDRRVLISEREAARRLAHHGRSLAASQHLLSTGIAGRPLRTAVATLYDEERVDDLVARPHIDAVGFSDAFPGGTVVARLPRCRSFDVEGTWPERAQTMSGPWRVTSRKRFLLAVTVQRQPGYPFLLSVAGHVVGGASIIGLESAADGAETSFVLEPAGEWLAPMTGRRLRGHRGPQVELVGWTARAVAGRDA